MMSKRKIRIYFLQIASIIFLLNPIYSQDNTIFYLQGPPQRYFTNPASQPECNIFIGIPMISSDLFQAGTRGFSPDQLIYKDPETGSIYYYSDKPALFTDFKSNLDKVNYISLNEAINVISFGFRVKQMYFTADYTVKINEIFAFPKELMNFIPPNLEDSTTYDLSALNIDLTTYSELAIGISKQFNEQLSIGIRPKMLFGLGTINSTGTDIKVYTGLREIDITAKSDLNVCVPWVDIPVDENGMIDFEQGIEPDTTINDPSDYYKVSLQNKGFGIDLGANYKPYRRLELSASIIDLGYIKWKSETHVVSLDGNYKFEGIEFYSADSVEFWDYIQDSIKSSLNVTGSGQSFTTYLNPKVLVGGRFFVTPAFDLGAVSSFAFFRKDVTSNISILADWRPSKVFSISASYGLLDGSYSTFGLGFSARLGLLNLYIISDDILANGTYMDLKGENFSIPFPKNMNSYNVRFGLNLVFGSNKIKKLMADKPMYYSTEY